MIKHPQQSKGFMPTKSGPNLSGFYMDNSSNLMQMYQTGGQTSRGAAMLARSRQRRSDIRKLEDQQRAEAKRQKRGGLFGSIGGIGGGLLGSAALGALGLGTGGVGLALAAGLGTALGKGVGERIGAGKSVDYDSSGTVYGQQSFRDIDESSEEFNKGILGRAGVAGLKAGITAGLTPGGGIYGKARGVGGKLRAAQLAKSVPIADTGLLNMVELKTPGIDMRSPIFDPLTGSRTGDVISQSKRVFDPSTGAGIGALPDMQFTTEGALGGVESGLSRGLSLDIPFSGMEDGGLIEYQYGGGVGAIKSILQDSGMSASPEQLALFEQFDPTSLNRLAEGLQDSLFSGTQQAQQQQAGMGFAGSGAVQQAQTQQRESAMDQLGSAQAQAARDFESQTLGQAASMISEGAEFRDYVPSAASAPATTVTSLPTVNQGNVSFNGVTYVWDSASGSYISQEEYEAGQEGLDYSEYEDYG